MVSQGRQIDPEVNQFSGALTCETFSSQLTLRLEHRAPLWSVYESMGRTTHD